MTGIYGITERNRLKYMAATIQADAPNFWAHTPEFTDALRLALPDIDDLTIGRVLNELANQIAAVQDTEMESVANLYAAFACAGLQLTREEWEDA